MKDQIKIDINEQNKQTNWLGFIMCMKKCAKKKFYKQP